MTQTQKTRMAWIGCIIAVIALLSGAGWIFREEIAEMSPDVTKAFSKQVRTPDNNQPVPRTNSYLGRIRTAENLLSEGQLSRAAIELSAAISERPDILRPYVLLGEVHIRAHDFTKIAGLITELERRFPASPETDVLRARELIAREDFKSAQAILKTANTNTLDPSMQLYQTILAALQNDHATAKTLLTALSDIPVREPLIVGDDGVTEVEMTTSITPELSAKVEALRTVYSHFSQFADGEDPHLFALLAKALAENNEPMLARSFADVAIREDISYVDAWMLRGYANFLLNNLPSALEDLRHAYKLDPVRPEVEYFLALTLEKSGQKMEAALFYEKLLTREFAYKSEVRWKLIELLTEKQEIERVIELYLEQAAAEPAPGKFVSALHTVINVLHRPEDALKITETIFTQQPKNILSINLRAWALIESGQFTEAETLLEKAEDLNPENPRTQLNFGLLRERQGNPIAAREFYKKCYELGEGQPFNSVVELAVERYNTLLKRSDEAAPAIAPSSP
jgi:tetratricopeptide (TPR) repeat protein